MATYRTKLRTPFFIDHTAGVTAGSSDLTIEINSADVYVLSKDTVSNRATFEVSELIKDYLSITWDGTFPFTSQVVTATITQDFFTGSKATRAAVSENPIVGQTQTHTLYGFDGYSNFKDGANHQIVQGSLLQTNTTMYLSESDVSYVASESSNTISYTAIQTTDTTVTVGGIVITIERLCEPVFTLVRVIFINKFGAFQELWFNKKSVESLTVQQEEYDAMLVTNNTYSTTAPQKIVNNKQGSDKIQLNTGYVEEGQYEAIKELMLSENVWAKIGSTVYPMKVVSNSLTKKTKVNDRIVNNTLDIEFAYDVVNNVR